MTFCSLQNLALTGRSPGRTFPGGTKGTNEDEHGEAAPMKFCRKAESAKVIFRAFAIVLLTCLLTGARSFAQKITLAENNIPLKKALDMVKKQTGCGFLYEKGLLDTAGTVTIHVRDAEIQEVLAICFEGKPFVYVISGNTVSIKRKKVSASPSTDTHITLDPDSLVYGRFTDSAGKTLAGVTITNMTRGGPRKIRTLSGFDGSFVIKAVKGDRLQFTSVGYVKANMKYNGEQLLNIVLKVDVEELKGISITYGDVPLKKKIPWTDTIDLTHRSYLNLGQVLQGTIPGLTLQRSSQAQQTFETITGVFFNGKPYMTISDLQSIYAGTPTNAQTYGSFENWMNWFLSVTPSNSIHYGTTVTDNGLVPQLRGVSGFSGNTSGMLIVIDGFPQSGFDANYPMTNVESIKVIKDPEELAKWGPSGAGGVILITTKHGEAGKIKVKYQANFYYSPAPRFNRNRQRLASSPDVLDYIKSAYDSGFTTYGIGPGQYLFYGTPADELLWGLNSKALPQTAFNQKWDSLGRLDNQGQLNLLQQNIMYQNQTLTLSGGIRHWEFRVDGSYVKGHTTTALGNDSRQLGLNMHNTFALPKNKLQATWILNITSSNVNAGHPFDPSNNIYQEPYQLLLDPKGRYLYDYSQFNPDANAVMMAAGYQNYGVNVLQDDRLNHIITKTLQASSGMTLNWNVSPCLKWNSSFLFSLGNSSAENYQDAQSSQARQLVDDFASPGFDAHGNIILDAAGNPILTHYVPQGGMLTRSFSKTGAWNLRTGLLFNKHIDKHDIFISIGANGSENSANSPAYSTLYGYGPNTPNGQPILLPSLNPQALVANYYSLPAIAGPGTTTPINLAGAPYTLLTPFAVSSTNQRILGWNSSLKYVFDNTYIVKASYVAMLNPNYGYNPPYTTQSNYQAEAGWRLSNQHFFHPPGWVSDLYLSAGVNGVEIPNLPPQISATRSLQTDWSNYGIWVSGYNTAQQNGQNFYTTYEKLSLGLLEKAVVLDISYNTLHTGYNTNSKDSSNSRYLGAGARFRLRKETLFLTANYGRSPEGQAQTYLNAAYYIDRESYFHSKHISRLELDFILKNISPYQAMESMTGTNVIQPDGSFSQATVPPTSFGLLPSQIQNMEAHGSLGFLKDRYVFDLRYYQTTTSGLNNSIPVPTDPATGLTSQISYSKIVKKGVELYIVMRVVKQKDFHYTILLNGSYNKDLAEQVPTVYFSQSPAYLTAYRSGYSTGNLWSYRWAGLDNQGNPQIYDLKKQKTTTPDSASLGSALVYSGVTRAPYTGGFIQEWGFKGFFARVSILLNMGHVMREYIPSPTATLDNSILIRDRWRQPGDELHTDVPAMTNTTAASTRTFITQNSTNSILPADNIRLQEVQIGWQTPKTLPQGYFVKNITLTFQVRNAAVWVRNKLHVDPETVASGGQIGVTANPRQYSFTVMAEF